MTPTNGDDLDKCINGKIDVRLERREWKILLAVLSVLITLATLACGALFYVMTPRQVHDEDVAALDKDVAVIKERQKDVTDLKAGMVEQNKAIQAIYLDQQIELNRRRVPKRVRSTFPTGLLLELPEGDDPLLAVPEEENP